MEPAYERRENRGRPRSMAAPSEAAMEPAYERRENPARGQPRALRPQWSPPTKGGRTFTGCRPDRPAHRGRNGARLRKAGELDRLGRSRLGRAGRNGARLRKAGEPCTAQPPTIERTCRNGARLRKAGELRRRPAVRRCWRSAPQWSPPTKGGRTSDRRHWPMRPRMPQWSPPTKGGRTRRGSALGRRSSCAAMEPAYERRENRVAGLWTRRARHAAMEPAYERRENRRTPATCTPASRRRRNGARLRKAGEPASRRRRPGLGTSAAMEPAYERRENAGQPLATAAADRTRRNGARLRKAGEPPIPVAGVTGDTSCRNGARLRKAGERAGTRHGRSAVRPQWSPPTKGGRHARGRPEAWRADDAAMEPADERRENAGRGHARTRATGAAMEPAVRKAGATRLAGSLPVHGERVPQWSPPTKGGSTLRDCRRRRRRQSPAAMEPADERRENLTWPDIGVQLARAAAMEPADERREHRRAAGGSCERTCAAMEPAVRKAGEPGAVAGCRRSAAVPQWSPPMKGGRTCLRFSDRRRNRLTCRNGARR